MNVITGVIIGLGWLIVGVVNLIRGGHWTVSVFDFVLGLVFLALAVRRALRDIREDEQDDDGK